MHNATDRQAHMRREVGLYLNEVLVFKSCLAQLSRKVFAYNHNSLAIALLYWPSKNIN